MDPHVFFSFHYERDIWRANQVRNSWVTKTGDEVGGRFVDASLWEETKLRGNAAIRALIDEGLDGTDATVVLIGNETADRPWVRYEIQQSWLRNNKMIGVRIHRLKDQHGQRDLQGANPFSRHRYDGNKTLRQIIPVYEWNADSGYENLAEWLEEAPRREDFEGLTAGDAVLVGAAALGIGYLLKKAFERRDPPPR